MAKVLVTGSSGRIGRAVVSELLARGHDVRGFDLTPNPELADQIVGTLTRPDQVKQAVAGRDTLIHLAATPDDDDFLARIVPNNIIGVHNVLEAAREAGVRRLVLASSGQVVWYDRLRATTPLGPDVKPTPRYWYAAAKVFLEAAGRAFAEKFGQQVLAVRLGWCPRSPEQEAEIAALDWAQDVYLSPGDAGRFFAAAVETEKPFGFEVVYATSRPVHWSRYDQEGAKRVLGYEGRDRWPEGLTPR